jgi:hypothetical protein
MADAMVADDPSYFQRFWAEAGYVGHDEPGLASAVIDAKAVVKRVVTATELLAAAEAIPGVGALAKFMVGMKGPDFPCAFELEGDLPAHATGASLRFATGAAVGRSLYVAGIARRVWYVDGADDAGVQRLAGVVAGDELVIDNRDFLAFCYSYRHHAAADRNPLAVDGTSVFPQHPLIPSGPLQGGPASGRFTGKLLLLPATHDSNVWPGTAVALMERIAQVQGPEGAARVRIRWMEHAENLPGSFIPPKAGPAMTTRFIDYNPIVEQSLHDLAAWVEDDIAPRSTGFEYVGGRLHLAATGHERAGVQAVVTARVDGGARAEVQAGQPVALEVEIDVPPDAGAVVGAVWDVEGRGEFAHPLDLPDEPGNPLRLTLQHSFDLPGSYFPCVRVTTHRDGDRTAVKRVIPNLGRVRVVVSEA